MLVKSSTKGVERSKEKNSNWKAECKEVKQKVAELKIVESKKGSTNKMIKFKKVI